MVWICGNLLILDFVSFHSYAMPPSGKAKFCAQPVCHISSQIFSHPASTDRVNLLPLAVAFAFVTLYYLTLDCAAFSDPARAITCGPHMSRTLGFLPSCLSVMALARPYLVHDKTSFPPLLALSYLYFSIFRQLHA